MSLVIREMHPDDARAFLEVHHAAVRGLAAKDYPTPVVDAWARVPVTDRAVESVRSNQDGEYRLVAEIEGRIVGIGALIVGNSELCACCVAPKAPASVDSRRAFAAVAA